MTMTLELDGHSFSYQMEHIIRIFYPRATIKIVANSLRKIEPPAEEPYVKTVLSQDSTVHIYASIRFSGKEEFLETTLPKESTPKQQKTQLSRLLFILLSRHTGIAPPWGMLVGVRPVRLLAQKAQAQGMEKALEEFSDMYQVHPAKIALALTTYENQQTLTAVNHSKAYSLYINIPFCPTRCAYCSFVSHDIKQAEALVPEYVERLCEELRYTVQLAQSLGLELQTIYIGGGTPTTLSSAQLERIFITITESYGREIESLLEFTVEAGRPDTVTQEKLEMLLRYGVNRISINPQSMSDEVLKNIDRQHTVQQTLDAYTLAREMGFEWINMDLIAGLPGETKGSFEQGIEQILALRPDNFTVHTLTVKRSSYLREQEERENETNISAFLAYAVHSIEKAGYKPYYLYRQKGTLENLENIGFSLPEKFSYYNIYSMEEDHSILAVGAGGVSKLCAAPDIIKRVFNHKYPYEYLAHFEEVIKRKSAIRSFYETDH